MRTIEQNFLIDHVKQIHSYGKQHSTAVDFFEHIEDMPDISLQAKCREHDFSFLCDIQKVINVILSIVEHPHIASRREEIVSRIELVKQLSNEDFTRSLKEPGFWKSRGLEMVPEKVYYHQNVDELAIYENKFICLLINILEGELKQYVDLYLAMLPIIANNSLVDADKTLIKTMKKAKMLLKKINFIKNTRFYRTISKTSPISRHIEKTNILIHDNLYKQCYTFYTKNLLYNNIEDVKEELSSYYLTIILKEFVSRGFTLVVDGDATTNKKWILKSVNFDVTLTQIAGVCAFALEVNLSKTEMIAKHILMISSSINRDDIDEIPLEYRAAEDFDVLTLWSLTDGESLTTNKELVSTLSERQLIAKWLDSKLTLVDVSHDMYTIFCPVCKATVEENENEFYCPECHSKYKYFQRENISHIWFINRKKNAIIE